MDALLWRHRLKLTLQAPGWKLHSRSCSCCGSHTFRLAFRYAFARVWEEMLLPPPKTANTRLPSAKDPALSQTLVSKVRVWNSQSCSTLNFFFLGKLRTWSKQSLYDWLHHGEMNIWALLSCTCVGLINFCTYLFMDIKKIFTLDWLRIYHNVLYVFGPL